MTKTTRKPKSTHKRKQTVRSAGSAKSKTPNRVSSPEKKADGKPQSDKGKAKQTKSREDTKADTILKLLQRKGGATIDEMSQATRWQPHSVRGFLSGTVKKRLGHNLKSEKASDGVRRYHVGATS